MAHEFDEVVVNGFSGEITIPNPRTSKVYYDGKKGFTNPFGEPDEEFVETLKEIGESVRKKNVEVFQESIRKAVNEVIKSAKNRDLKTGVRFTELCEYLQDEILKILEEVYSGKDLLKKFVYVDKYKKYRDEIEHIYFILRETIQSLDRLEIDGQK